MKNSEKAVTTVVQQTINFCLHLLLFLCLILTFSKLDAQDEVSYNQSLNIELIKLSSECVSLEDEYEIAFLAYAHHDQLPLGTISIVDDNGSLLYSKFIDKERKIFQTTLTLENSHSSSYHIIYKNTDQRIVAQKRWETSYALDYKVQVEAENISDQKMGKIIVENDAQNKFTYQIDNKPATLTDLNTLRGGVYELIVEGPNGCQKKSRIYIPTLPDGKTLKNKAICEDVDEFEECLSISEACDNDAPIELIMLGDCDPNSTDTLPRDGTFELYQLYKFTASEPPYFKDTTISIARNNYLVDINGLTHFDVTEREGNYKVYYSYMENGSEYCTSDLFDVQAVNPQIELGSGVFCQNAGLLEFKVNPTGGNLMAPAGLIDINGDPITLIGGSSRTFLVDPSLLKLDTPYVYSYTYSNTGNSGLSCEKTTLSTITVLPPPSVEILSFPDTSCYAEEISLVGLTSPVEGYNGQVAYEWRSPDGDLLGNGATVSDLSADSSGYYTIIGSITYSNNLTCYNQDSAKVKVLDLPEVSLSSQGYTSCADGSDGSILATTTNEDTSDYSLYQFSWSSPDPTLDLRVQDSSSRSISNLPAGMYILSVTNPKNCVNSATISIIDPDPVQIICTDDLISPSCADSADGIDSISVSGGFSPYLYSLDSILPFTSDPVLTGISIGWHDVYVLDSLGCLSVCSFYMDGPDTLEIIGNLSQELTCYGDQDAIIDPTIIGGVGPYVYRWSDKSSDTLLSQIGPGDYQLTITDANGCIDSLTIPVTEPSDLELQCRITSEISCFGANDGKITAKVTGGTGPYRMSWIPGDTVEVMMGDSMELPDLYSDAYFITVIDDNGCLAYCNTTISSPPMLSCTIQSDTLQCHGDSTGILTVAPIGGTPPYRYEWSDLQAPTTSPERMGLKVGQYTVTVTDSLGCSTQCTGIVYEYEPLMLSFDVIDSLFCHGASTGQIVALASGGLSPYKYIWEDGTSTATIMNVNSGYHTVTVMDALGCMHRDSFNIMEPTPLLIELSNDTLLCHDDENGIIEVKLSGGSWPYTYKWSRTEDNQVFSTASSVDGLAHGGYILMVTDRYGCSTMDTAVVIAPDSLIGRIENKISGDTTLCLDERITLLSEVTGGMGNYSYQWTMIDPGTTMAVDTNLTHTDSSIAALDGFCLKPGVITLKLLTTDDNDCIHMDTVRIVLSSCFDLAIRKTTSATLVTEGDTVQFLIEAFNQGTQTAYDIEVSDMYPPDFIWYDTVLNADQVKVAFNEGWSRANEVYEHIGLSSSCSSNVSTPQYPISQSSTHLIDIANIEEMNCIEVDQGCASFEFVNIPPAIGENINQLSFVPSQSCSSTDSENLCLYQEEVSIGSPMSDTVRIFPRDTRYTITICKPGMEGSVSLHDITLNTVQPLRIVTQTIDSIMGGQQVDLSINFVVKPNPQNDEMYNEARITDYSNAYKNKPIDQDDFVGVMSIEKDDDICDESVYSDDPDCQVNNPDDEDKIDGAVVRRCLFMPSPIDMTICTDIESGINLSNSVVPILNTEILSYHSTLSDAQGNVNPITEASLSGVYWMRLSDSNGCIGTSQLTLTINNNPEISMEPMSVEVCPIEDIVFSVEAEGIDITYQWQRSENGSWGNIPNATEASLNIGLYTSSIKDTKYRVLISQVTGSYRCEVFSREVQGVLNPCESTLVCVGEVNVTMDPITCDTDLPDYHSLLKVDSPYPHEVRIYDDQGIELNRPFDGSPYDGKSMEYRVYNLSTGAYCWGNAFVTKKVIPNAVHIDTIWQVCGTEESNTSQLLEGLKDSLSSLCFAPVQEYKIRESSIEQICDTVYNKVEIYGSYKVENEIIDSLLLTQIRATTPISVHTIEGPYTEQELTITCDQSVHPDSLMSYYDDTSTAGYNEGISYSKPHWTGELIPIIQTVINNFTGLMDTDTIYLNAIHDITQSNGCNLKAVYTDTSYPTCLSGRDGKIYRDWLVTNWCTEEVKHFNQFISIIDTVGPNVDPIEDMVISILPWTCEAILTLPEVTAVDGCSDYINVRWKADKGTIVDNKELKEIVLLDSPVKVTLEAFDDCGNVSERSFYITLKDELSPVAVCRDLIQTSSGPNLSIENGIIKASAFDGGSHDGGCGPITTSVIRMEDFENGPLTHQYTGDVLTDINGEWLYPAVNPCYQDGTTTAEYILNGDTVTYNIPYVVFSSQIEFCCDDTDEVNVVMRVTDQVGNVNYCMPMLKMKEQEERLQGCNVSIELECADDYSPQFIGQPYLESNCDTIYLAYTDEVSTINCGQKIIRKWSDDDNVLCTQTITIQSKNSLDPLQIRWPMSYDGDQSQGTIIDCDQRETTGTISHNDILSCNDTIDEPIATESSACSLIAPTYSDERFDISGLCKVIKRSWVIIDWCKYEPNNQQESIPEELENVYDQCTGQRYVQYKNVNTDGYYTYDHYIKFDQYPITFNLEPITFKPIESEQGCQYSGILKGKISSNCNLPHSLVDNMSWEIDIISDSSDIILETIYGSGSILEEEILINKDADAYKAHIKTYQACVNSIIDTTFSLIAPPNETVEILCKGSFVIDTELNKHGEYILSASELVDNQIMSCEQVFYFKTAEGSFTDHLVLRCSDFEGGSRYNKTLPVYLIENRIPIDSCRVSILIQLNQVCDTGNSAEIKGSIKTTNKQGVEAVEISLTNGEKYMSNGSGEYEITNMNMDNAQSIIPNKSNDILNGVNIVDLILLQRHIIGISPLNDPYLLIAADITGDERITGLDASVLRKTLLGYQNDFGHQKSWRFVAASHKFLDNLNPYPYMAEVSVDQNYQSNPDFIGVKIGDLNLDAVSNSFQTKNKKHANKGVLLIERSTNKETETKYTLRARGYDQLNGLYLNMYIGNSELVNISSTFFDINQESYQIENGELSIIALYTEPRNYMQESVIIEITLKENQNGITGELPSPLVIISENGKDSDFPMIEYITDHKDINELIVRPNIPNPFQASTTFEVVVEREGEMDYAILDDKGRLYSRQYKTVKKGKNQITITNDILDKAGIYYVRFEFGQTIRTKKIIKIN